MASAYTKATKIDKESEVQEFQFKNIPRTTKWEDIKKGLWDSDKKEFFGRNAKSWYQLGIFYTIFYICLAVLSAICMQGLLASLDDKQPSYILEDSLIGTNPGLGFRPISNETIEGSLIWYNLNDTESSQKWVELVDDFLKSYQIEQVGKNYQLCDYNTPPAEGHVCSVTADRFGPCVRDEKYGYDSQSPCVFLKLNKIFGWTPEPQTTIEEEMSEDVKLLVENSHNSSVSAVWISCEGENEADRERIGGFKYFPSQGFPDYYFPYTNTENYLSPIIAVQISNVEANVIVNVECRAWAKNIQYSKSRNQREGSVHFEVLVD